MSLNYNNTGHQHFDALLFFEIYRFLIKNVYCYKNSINDYFCLFLKR